MALLARRRDLGGQVSFQRHTGDGTTDFGLRIRRIRADYLVRDPSTDEDAESPSPPFGPPDAAWETAINLDRAGTIGSAVSHRAGASLSLWSGNAYLAPYAGIEWRVSEFTSLSASFSRSHQFTQSASNPESLIRYVFPADLAVLAGQGGVPVPRSDLGVLGVDWRPGPGVLLSAKGFVRRMDRLLLVGPGEAGPFASGDSPIGSGKVSGMTADATASGARYVASAGYAWQRLEFETPDAEAVPAHGFAHRIDAGIVVFPTPTLSFRGSAVGEFGRRGTAIAGAFEWEACNLIDQGCEFAGTPLLDGSVGGVALPDYFSVNLGLRKHWHVRIAGRDSLLALFATVTNLFGRRNVLAYATDGETAETTAVEMLPLSPLVIGVDWEF